MMYCFIMMITEEPGTESVFGGLGIKRSYEMKILSARSQKNLLKNYIEQVIQWKENHVYNNKDAVIKGLDYPKLLLNRMNKRNVEDGEFEEMLFYHDITIAFLPNVKSLVKSNTFHGIYYGENWLDFCHKWNFIADYETQKKPWHIPASPRDFDTNAIESAEAYEMLAGESSHEKWNCWQRYYWTLNWKKEKISAKELEMINEELYRIAHEPKIDDKTLRFFDGQYEEYDYT